MPPPPGCVSWDRLLSAPAASSLSPLPETSHVELRGLAFYRQVVAPAMCGPLDSSFWTKLVAQMVHSEPATRHAVLAISWLYENFGHATCGTSVHGEGESEATVTTTTTKKKTTTTTRAVVHVARDDFAIRHYNAAISHLIGLQTSCPADLNTVLLVCILFTCIEFLRGDAESAISHSQHGISLLNSGADIKPELLRVFRHLGIFPYFFGGEISASSALHLRAAHADAVAFDSLDDAVESLDCLLARAVRLVRASDHHRLGPGVPEQSLQTVIHEKDALEAHLDAWRSALDKLRRGVRGPGRQVRTMTLLVLQMRWLVCKIWANTCLAHSETMYDDHLDRFTRIADVASRAAQSLPGQRAAPTCRNKFMFVMGFCPLLYFVATKCRFLRLRLRALSLLQRLSCMRETLWDASTLYAIGKRIVEIEHGLGGLTAEDVDAPMALPHADLPADEARVRDCAVEDVDRDGGVTERRVCFLMLGSEGIERVYEWVRC
ncbi:C6 zinc finger domain protein [Metarhizium album ARSEF 1941]|uniref:C6 zinc finger domain protein n=1 Tax=Metarhizium album (strain ARSEF 1941) TaxID=1081103 RepID=A0A0B2WK55_METAS|nr:C6 zinc finger domain protein [Metarhizium album ARSEF 1941]KHN94074.1 C6 zinc finger domain protein [Metarhizium album ARSEF 1941]